MFSLIDFTKAWASAYKPMLHGRKDSRGRIRKRFFCIESIAQIANFTKELPTTESPFVAVETNIGGTITERFMSPEYNVYFFVMGNGKLQDNDELDTMLKKEAMTHATRFLSYLKKKKEAMEKDGMIVNEITAIDTDNIRFETFGPFLNRWFCVGIAMRGLEKLGCYNEDDYLKDGTE